MARGVSKAGQACSPHAALKVGVPRLQLVHVGRPNEVLKRISGSVESVES